MNTEVILAILIIANVILNVTAFIILSYRVDNVVTRLNIHWDAIKLMDKRIKYINW